MTAVVRERVRWLERALHGIPGLPEHGVKESITGDQRTDGLQRAHFVAKGCKSSSIEIVVTNNCCVYYSQTDSLV